MLHGTIRNGNFLRNTALQCWDNVAAVRNHVAIMFVVMLCCAKNRRCDRSVQHQGQPTGNFEKKTEKQQQSRNKAFWSHFKHFGRLLEKIYLFLIPSKDWWKSSQQARCTYNLQPDSLEGFPADVCPDITGQFGCGHWAHFSVKLRGLIFFILLCFVLYTQWSNFSAN